ncbi:MAG: DUF748 domain-containing protein [Xanthomonadaceae bacterium]|nr:DUF748 domain-containing protein [Xanthomonadaceae bacterium]
MFYLVPAVAMRKKIKKIALRSGAVFLFLFFLALISLPNLVDLENYRSQLVTAIQSQVAGTVTARRLKLYVDREIGVKIIGFSLTDGDKQQISAEEVKIGFHIWPLLHRQLEVSSVRLIRPVVHLQAIKGEPFGSGLIRQPEIMFPAKPHCTTISSGDSSVFTWCNTFNDVRLQIKKGLIAFTDRHFCVEPVTTRLQGLDFKLHLSGSSEPASFRLSAATVTKRQTGHLRIEGSLSGLSWPLDWGGIQLDCQVHGQNLDGDQYWPYYQKHVPMRRVGGRVSVDGSYRGNLLGHFISRGSIDLDDAVLDYQRVFAARLPIRHLTVSYQFQLVKDYITIDIPEVRIESDDFSIRGSCRLEDVRRGKQGRISASFSSNQLDLEQLYRYLPIKIMAPQLRKFWQEQDPRGLVQISNAYLQGSYDQIAGIGRRQTLSPTLLGGTLWLSGVSLKAPGMPGRWQNLTGNLVAVGEKIEFVDLHCDMPPFFQQRLNGSLTSWHHEPRLTLVDNFVLTLPDEPRLNDDFKVVAAAFLGKRLPKLAVVVADCRQLSGGFAGSLHLDGNLSSKSDLTWQLDGTAKDLAIRHPNLGRPLKKVSGDFHCSSRFLEFQNFSAMVGNSPLTFAGRIADYHDPQKLKLDLSLASTAVLPEDFSIIPRIKVKSAAVAAGSTVQPSSFEIEISGFPHNPSSMRVDGQLDLRHLAVSLPWRFRGLDDVTLVGDCRGRKFILHELSCRSGSSDLELSGDFSAEGDSCQIELTGKSGFLDFDDFLAAGKVAAAEKGEEIVSGMPLPFRDAALKLLLRWPKNPSGAEDGEVSPGGKWWNLKAGKYFPLEFPEDTFIQLEQLSFARGDSDFYLAGRLQLDSLGNFHGSLHQVSGQLRLADFFPRPEKEATLISQLEEYRHYLLGQEVSFSSRIQQYVGRNMKVDDLNCRAVVGGNRLEIKPLTGSLWLGKGTISGSWDLNQDIFALTADLEQIDLAQFNQSLTLYSEKSLPLEGTGKVNMGFTWSGNDLESWNRTLDGKANFSFVKGRLKRFPVLANIASLLNISQLLTLHLPDLSKGVPYASLDGSFKVKGGVMQTDDLLLKGPSVNISAGGSISLPNRQVDMEVGIQPLQTIDKVIAAVPVVGYIVTGKGRTFIVMRFSVRGPFGKTAVAAIPVRGLVGKTGGILKRLITTPVRVLSWPGKILSPAKKKVSETPGASGTAEDKKP